MKRSFTWASIVWTSLKPILDVSYIRIWKKTIHSGYLMKQLEFRPKCFYHHTNHVNHHWEKQTKTNAFNIMAIMTNLWMITFRSWQALMKISPPRAKVPQKTLFLKAATWIIISDHSLVKTAPTKINILMFIVWPSVLSWIMWVGVIPFVCCPISDSEWSPSNPHLIIWS